MGSTSQSNSQTHTEDESFLFAMQLASASVLPMVLKSAVELDLLEIMAKAGPGPSLMDMLSGYIVSLPCVSSSTKNADGVSVAPLLLMNQDKVLMESWYHLKDAVLDGGIPFNKAYGMTAFEYHGTDPRFNKVFNHYKGFEGLNSVVDVGGGTGQTVNMIVSKHPSIKGINFDLPHVIEDAPTYPCVEHVGGDMFVSVPKADAIFMKWICHDWSDDHCLKFLKNCYEALPANGKVIIAECLLPEAPDTSFSTKNTVHVDVIMLAHNPGGKERTEKEFEALAKAVGFKGFLKACCAYNTWVMEFNK
ncbi:hypothetical protein K7X08_035365 [Anisodus acutangulus]|uniref:O-methyltransferase C-terminal domain-containing protein n=1 Tax=Anisodus acutangulus TaxID=402998 RepID=A0A9Q1LHF7_9SOLA|nr:hypothetical protein K7X08_035365 [Anisodus acutangulus]